MTPCNNSPLRFRRCELRSQREELDWSRLECYLRDRFDDVEGPFAVTRFTGGLANLTYLVSIGDTEMVVRRPPFGQIAPGAHDMAREYRALSRLWQAYDRAPRAFLLCEDSDVLGATFFVMEHRRGLTVKDQVPPALQVGQNVGMRLGLALVDALADLHNVDPASCGLEELGHPDGFVARQMSGWSKRWELVANEGAEIMNKAKILLELTQPRNGTSTILHNDFKLDNCQFKPGRPDRVFSVFDWDMATLGDPLVDVGTLLSYWPDPTDTPNDRGVYAEGLEQIGMPSHADVVARYIERTGADLAAIAWYQAFACWKTAVVLRQLEARYLAGQSDDKVVMEQAQRIPELAARALRILDQASKGASQ
jgi:aminoglycoside phosphotransferase (APT) family kinase protein